MQVGDPNDPELGPKVAAAMGEIIDYFWRACRARRADPRDDLISALVTTEVDGRMLDDEEAANFSMLLLLAGHITTTRAARQRGAHVRREPGRLGRAARRPRADPRRDRGGAAAAVAVHAGRPGTTLRAVEIAASSIPADALVMPVAAGRQPRPAARTPTRTASTSAAGSAAARSWRSGTACTSASAPRWPGWRAGSRWRSSPGATGALPVDHASRCGTSRSGILGTRELPVVVAR